ncbi:MAG: AAA family ATPase [Planctomycetes bacterium]|nr:AAA family ATPase [Planctomycetota bacterium]
MYQTHWGLEKPPFPSGLDPKLFFEGASQRESLARLRFLLAHRRRLGLVLGASGMGKSLLLSVFAEQCRLAGHAAGQVDLLGLSTREFFWQLGNKLHAAVRTEDDLLRLFRQVADRLQENALQKKQTVLLLDDLDQAGPDLQNQVQRLLRTDAAHGGWLTLVATANSTQLNRLGQGLLEAVDLRIDLHPWDELDTIGYLQMALFEAGAERPLFDDEAMSNLHRASEGVPRMVNRLADSSLLAGANHSQEMIDASTIQAASEAISLPTNVALGSAGG